MKTALVWFRQDLRLLDNPAFSEACSKHEQIIAIYILDRQTIPLGGAQSWWLHHSLVALSESLKKRGLNLLLRQGDPIKIMAQLAEQFLIDTVYWNRCYEPLAIQRDKKIKLLLTAQGAQVNSSNGSLFNEPWNIKNTNGGYFKVFTPFWRHCLQIVSAPELWQTGYMHNRVRMIVASFLTKDLFIDWRLGADWFLDTLVDADLANNSTSWQWVSGSGADAAPYFRIFNPILQSKKFDPQGAYIKHWLPELAKVDNQLIHEPWTACKHYPKPIVDHDRARKVALHYYQLIKK